MKKIATLDTITSWGNIKIWGQHSLVIGEAVAFAIGFALMYFGWFGKWSFWLGVAIILIATIIF